MVGLTLPSAARRDGLRPVNLRTDLGPLADLIEMAFADTMDSSGRAAIREMRALARMGFGLNLLVGMNEVAQGVGLGYVWMEADRLVGNTSIYPATLPSGAPKTWLIANVAVHPEFRGRGIARTLVATSLEAIRAQTRGRPIAILQVEEDNFGAQHLYETLGFVRERAWTHWRRASNTRIPPPLANQDVYMTRRTGREWRAEMALAERVRPQALGGVGWLRPVVPGLFHRTWWRNLGDLVNLRSIERLIVRSDDNGMGHDAIAAALWIESGFATSSTQFTLMNDPNASVAAEALLHSAVRRHGAGTALTIEHPGDDVVTGDLLRRYHFTIQRRVMTMRWEG